MRRRVWVAKGSTRSTAEELKKIVESRGQKTFKKLSNSPYITTCCSERVSRKIILAHPKTNSSLFSNQARLELQMGLASMVRWNKKISFLAANTQDGFGEHRDKKYPMCTMKYAVVCFYVVGLYFCWRSWTSCLDAWHHGFYQIPTDKKNQ